MDNQTPVFLRLELLWILFTVLVFCLIAAPVYLKLPDFPFFLSNFLFVAVFITASRYIFHLKHTFIAKKQVLKIFLFFASIPLTFFLVSQIYSFKTFLDEEGAQALVGTLPYEEESPMAGYIQTEMLLFGVGSVIATIFFAFRMILSVWRLYNRGTV